MILKNVYTSNLKIAHSVEGVYMTGAGVAPGKAGRACRLTMLSRRRRAGETETVGRGLQLDEAGAGWGPGVGLTPWYQVLVP